MFLLFSRRRGFTLIELIVVMAIIAALLSVLLPAVQQMREAARRTQCKNNVKQVALALHNYLDMHSTFPPGYVARNVLPLDPPELESGSGFAWGTLLLPFLDQDALLGTIDLNGNATSPANAVAGGTQLSTMTCPSNSVAATFPIGDGFTTYTLARANYVGVYGFGDLSNAPGAPQGPGIFYRNSWTRSADIRDGMSNTFLVGERRNEQKNSLPDGPPISCEATWYAVLPGASRSRRDGTLENGGHLVLGSSGYRDAQQVDHIFAINSDDAFATSPAPSLSMFSSPHLGGCQMAMADGSVRFISENFESDAWRRMTQMADGKPTGEF